MPGLTVIPVRRILCCVLAAMSMPANGVAAEWAIDPAKSILGFTGTMAGVAFDGRFEKWDARISFDPAHAGQGHAIVTIDMASAVTGDPQKDEALPQNDWFNAGTFPKATFKVRTFEAKGGNAYDAIGDLAIRDVARPVAVPMTIELTAAGLHATGRLDLKRTDYGVGQGSWSSDQWVAFGVTVSFDVTARAAP